MPAMPAPSTSTEVPGGGGDSLIGSLKVEVSARASSVMAWYIAALPATTPIILRSERRLGAKDWSIMLSPRDKDHAPRTMRHSLYPCLEKSPCVPVFGTCMAAIPSASIKD